MELNRRQFIATVGAAAPLLGQAPRQQFAYVGCADSIRVFAIGADGQWTPVQKLASRRPAFLLLTQSGTTLFAANAIDSHEGCSRGTVESYRIAADSGRLKLLSRQPLSLSACWPSHLALATNDQHLIVTAFGGGAYNVLPVSTDGVLDHPLHIRKELGGLQSSAHPHSVVSHEASGLVVSSDLGCDRLNVFQLNNGQLEKHSVCNVKSGDGPSAIALVDNGRRLVIANTLSTSLVIREFNDVSGSIGREISRQLLSNSPLIAGQSSMTADVNAGQIFTATSNSALLKVWRFDARRDSVQLAQSRQMSAIAERGLTLLPNGSGLVTAEHQSHTIRHWKVDKVSGRLTDGLPVANALTPLSLVLA